MILFNSSSVFFSYPMIPPKETAIGELRFGLYSSQAEQEHLGPFHCHQRSHEKYGAQEIQE
jgi:hypothetical protein